MRFKPKHPELRTLMAAALAGSLGAAVPSALAFPVFPEVENTEDELPNGEDTSGFGGFTFGLQLPNAFDPVLITFEYQNVQAGFYEAFSGPTLIEANDPDDVKAMIISGQAFSRAFLDDGSGLPGSLTRPQALVDDDALWDLRIVITDGVFWNDAGGYFGVNSPNNTLDPGILDATNSRIRLLPSNNKDLSYTPGFDESSACVTGPTPLPTPFSGAVTTGSGDAGATGTCDVLISLDPDLGANDLAFQFFPNFPSEVVADGGEGFFPQQTPGGGVLIGNGATTGDCDPNDPNNNNAGGTINLCDAYYGTPPDQVNAAPNRTGGALQAVGTPQQVPEPGALGLASLGVVALAVLRRRRRRWS